MAEGWLDRAARCDEFAAIALYRHHDCSLEYELRGDPPVVMNVADEVLRRWGPRPDGGLTIHTTRGPIVYDVIGYDLRRNSWVAILVSNVEA